MRTLQYKYDKMHMENEKTQQARNLPEITDIKDFARLVKDMRHQQRRYFATRDKNVLRASKELEAKVDAIIASMFDTQMSLF